MMTNNNKSPPKSLTSVAEIGEVATWYNGRTIFITGGTGFMGKVLIEKLLYACPGLARIYVLMRSKKGKTPEARIEEMWKLPMFQRLRKQYPDAIKKIVPLYGDIVSDNLGLTVTSKARLHAEVSVVFHCAATLKLEANLKDSIDQNTGGTLRVLNLCKEMKQLEAFVHLSTAFCCCDVHDLQEKVYATSDNPQDVIQVSQWLRMDALEVATPKLIAPHPNTYTYSKRLAEVLVAEHFPELPIAIVRPSIVTPSWEEPIPGWVDSLNGPVGILVGAGKGVIRSMHCRSDYNAHIIPVDFAINGLITIAWRTATASPKPREIPVYNLTNDSTKAITWGEVLVKGRVVGRKYPFEMCLWYPDGNMRNSRAVHNFFAFFFHFLPAYFIDFLMLIFLQKRFMVRIYKRVAMGLELLQFFTTRQWKFNDKNYLSLWKTVSSEDRRRFPSDFNQLDTDEYLKRIILGARQYCMKEDPKTIGKCRVQHFFLYLLDRAVVLFFYGSIIWFLINYFQSARMIFDSATDYIKAVPYAENLVNKLKQ